MRSKDVQFVRQGTLEPLFMDLKLPQALKLFLKKSNTNTHLDRWLARANVGFSSPWCQPFKSSYCIASLQRSNLNLRNQPWEERTGKVRQQYELTKGKQEQCDQVPLETGVDTHIHT